MMRGPFNGDVVNRWVRSAQSILDGLEQFLDEADRLLRLFHGGLSWLTWVAKDLGIGGQSCHPATERLQRSVNAHGLEPQLVQAVGLAKAGVA